MVLSILLLQVKTAFLVLMWLTLPSALSLVVLYHVDYGKFCFSLAVLLSIYLLQAVGL